VQYADVACWQRERLQGERLEALLSYWRRQLQGSPPALGLATDHPRPAVRTSHGGNQSLELPESLSAALGALGRRAGATLFMTLLAGFQALLHRYTGSRDIVVGCPMATRGQWETEKLIGLFVNTLPFRTDLGGDPGFGELLGRVRAVALGAYAHQDLPFEKLVDALGPERSLSHTPLFQVVFQLRNYPQQDAGGGVLRMENTFFRPAAAQFDLTLEVTANGPRLACLLNYNAGLFEVATVRRMLGHYQTLLASAVADPACPISRLAIFTEAEGRSRVPCAAAHC
jgi:non-ribosomal peptide synthetase component F